jgi:hypothetical protein
MKNKKRTYLLSLSLGAALVVPSLAHACSCRGDTDLKSQFIRAQDVVIAEVTDTKLIKTVHKEHDLEYILANIEIIEDIKRSPDNKEDLTRVIDLVPETGNCSIELISGMEYIFFVDGHHYEDEESEMGWIKEDHYVGKCTGSRMINIYSVNFDEERAKLKELAEMNKLGELETSSGDEKDYDTVMSDSFKLNN